MTTTAPNTPALADLYLAGIAGTPDLVIPEPVLHALADTAKGQAGIAELTHLPESVRRRLITTGAAYPLTRFIRRPDITEQELRAIAQRDRRRSVLKAILTSPQATRPIIHDIIDQHPDIANAEILTEIGCDDPHLLKALPHLTEKGNPLTTHSTVVRLMAVRDFTTLDPALLESYVPLSAALITTGNLDAAQERRAATFIADTTLRQLRELFTHPPAKAFRLDWKLRQLLGFETIAYHSCAHPGNAHQIRDAFAGIKNEFPEHSQSQALRRLASAFEEQPLIQAAQQAAVSLRRGLPAAGQQDIVTAVVQQSQRVWGPDLQHCRYLYTFLTDRAISVLHDAAPFSTETVMAIGGTIERHQPGFTHWTHEVANPSHIAQFVLNHPYLDRDTLPLVFPDTEKGYAAAALYVAAATQIDKQPPMRNIMWLLIRWPALLDHIAAAWVFNQMALGARCPTPIVEYVNQQITELVTQSPDMGWPVLVSVAPSFDGTFRELLDTTTILVESP